MKNISILGSTGSIGRQALEVAESFPDKFNITGLSCGSNISLLAKQIQKFKPDVVSVKEEKDVERLASLLERPYPEIHFGEEGLIKTGEYRKNHMVLVALVGYAGLIPTIRAIKKGKNIALANKETLVTGGAIIEELLKENQVKLLPVDSEHSAIFQCLQNWTENDISRIILTASGGPFRNTPQERLKYIKPEEALNHPTWNMGNKITIDSSTLMNKGFEVIEARWLFKVSIEQIQVLIHPQSIIHSFVEFKDRSTLAQLSHPDMRLPIQYALSYPERWESKNFQHLDLVKAGSLTFEEPDREKFPCLDLAYRAIREGGTMPAVLNAANEVAVSAFLNKRIGFCEIPYVISTLMKKHKIKEGNSLDNVLEATGWGFEEARKLVSGEW